MLCIARVFVHPLTTSTWIVWVCCLGVGEDGAWRDHVRTNTFVPKRCSLPMWWWPLLEGRLRRGVAATQLLACPHRLQIVTGFVTDIGASLFISDLYFHSPSSATLSWLVILHVLHFSLNSEETSSKQEMNPLNPFRVTHPRGEDMKEMEREESERRQHPLSLASLDNVFAIFI